MSTEKKYQIVVPLYNDEENFKNLIKSLKSNGVRLKDVIVVASGQKGTLPDLCGGYGIRFFYERKKLTPAEARNLGAGKAFAEYIVFLDSDVLITESWKIALEELVNDRKKSLFGETYHMSSTPHWIETAWFEKIRKLKRSYINGGNLVIRKEIFDALGGFNLSLETGEDNDLCRRAADIGYPCFFDDRLIVRHEGNPKSIQDFVNRERWHAKGDLNGVREFLNSKVMLVSTIYAILLLVCLINVLFLQYLNVMLCFVAILALSVILTIYKLGIKNGLFPRTIFVMNLYLFGRASALLGKVAKRIGGHWRKSKVGKIS